MFIEPLHRPSPSRQKSIIATALLALLLFFVIMYNETPLSKGKSTFYIPSSNTEAVIRSLEENGYDVNFLDTLVLRFARQPKKGWYRIYQEEPGRFFFFKNLYKKRMRTLGIKIFAGETKKEIFYRLSRDLMLDEAKLDGNYTKLARFKEGNIIAGRYLLPRSSDEEGVIRYILDESNEKLDSFAQESFGSDFSRAKMRRALIIASIIQKESNDADEMPRISSVIHNRLKKGMKLQMDGTLNHGKYSRTVVTPDRIKNDRSRYNTYKYKGLIPAPLGSVSIDALHAAAFPAKSNYLFFVLNEKGKHVFSENYKSHLKRVRAFKAWLRERETKKKAEKQKEEEKRVPAGNKCQKEMKRTKKPVESRQIQKLFSDINASRQQHHNFYKINNLI